VAGIITIAKGHDASYPWKQIGAAEPGKSARGLGKGVGYYLSPAEKGGEPPGTWTGKGIAELGLHPGGIVDRHVFEPLYGQHLDPRDPSGETRLGRAPGHYKTAETIHATMLAAEPEATAERRAQLLIEAKAQVRTPDLYWDATFSVSKSISLFHASALANAAAAAQRGDLADVQAWEAVADGIWDAIMEGNTAALNYLQREAGQTRAGYHPGGRWEDARAWVVASFRQHTSRDGDPQLHVHNLILHKVRRESDGQWRALDSMSLYRHRPAASAIAALAAENALTRRFGVQWLPRADGHGREIAGVQQALMDMFSSRRRSIGPLAARLAQAFEAHFGRAPDARALASLRQWANHATRRGKDSAPLDMAALVRQWSAQARVSEAGALEPLAPALMGTGAHAPAAELDGQPGRAPAHARPLTKAQTRRLIAEAVAAVQTAQSTWTEADLIRHLGERLAAHVGAMSAPQAAALLPALARQALASEAVALAAPEWPRVPDCLRRASGESRYIPHGATRYANSAQLTLEERLLAHARETGAPRLPPAAAARFLGAEQAHLEARLQAHAPDHDDFLERPGSGLRLDQAAAAYHVLTSSRRAEVLTGPAGSGKTRTIAELARIWRQAGKGEVIGLATSQTACSLLVEQGVTRAYNTARFLGHLEEQREALGPMPVSRGSLLILDEASMMSLPDIAAILALARDRDCKVVVTGDHEQLSAVEGGGAMLLLAHALGFVQLVEPQRFTHAWERDATLRLRAGDVTVLADYEQHGRLCGGTAEEATEQAYRGWLADYLDGKDSLLMARTDDQARELSRRARGDLIRYGIVSAGLAINLAQGEQASMGDLVMARRNTSDVQAGQRGRDLANRDILRITGTGPRVTVRRLTGHDPEIGKPLWSAPFQVPKRYLASHATLAYATTQHAAQGRTVSTAHVLVDGLGDRQGLYVAMSRGRDANHAYCITDWSRSTDIAEGSRPDPELRRAHQLDLERAGLAPDGPAPGHPNRPASEPVTVLAGILARDGRELSAIETLQQELSRADHLGVLGSIWDDLTRRTQNARFEHALRSTLPAALASQALDDPACTWLWRSLRQAEAVGLDGAQVLRHAIAARTMAGARDIARVLDSRVRQLLGDVQPQPSRPWAEQVPSTGSADMDRYLRELADAMDNRTRRLGEHTATSQPRWACEVFGPVPENPVARLAWEDRASLVAAYRERYGYAHPADPIGPAPAKTNPEAWAAWHAALTGVGHVDGVDLRGCTDGELWLRRAAYERETAWAPAHVGDELRIMRIAEHDAHVNAVRAEHELRAAHDDQTTGRHQKLAQIWRALEDKAATEVRVFAAVQDTRRQWEKATETTRRVAIAADLELRRRHPGRQIPELRPHPAEADGIAYPATPDLADETGTGMQLTLNRSEHSATDTDCRAQSDERTSNNQHEAAVRRILGLTQQAAYVQIPQQVLRIRHNARIAQAKLDDLAHTSLSGTAEAGLSSGSVWPTATLPERDAVLQPPRPDVDPAAQILESHQARTTHPEAEPG
jgi:conjugative relaxase-like TrwC/TraI family protein